MFKCMLLEHNVDDCLEESLTLPEMNITQVSNDIDDGNHDRPLLPLHPSTQLGKNTGEL